MAINIIKNKKGQESVEVWMWIIAGMVIGAIIFGSGYTMLAKCIRGNEVKLAQENYSLLRSSVVNVCALGFQRQEVKRFIFPTIVNNISVQNKSTEETGSGNLLCISIENEGEFCDKINEDPYNCHNTINMKTIDFKSEKNLFGVI